MLVVVNGIQNFINQGLINKKLTRVLNTFVVDGFFVEFDGDQAVIKDQRKNVILKTIHPDTESDPVMNITPTEDFTHDSGIIDTTHVLGNPDLTEDYGADTPVSNSENVAPEIVESVQVGLPISESVIRQSFELINQLNNPDTKTSMKTKFVDIFHDLGLVDTHRVEVDPQTAPQDTNLDPGVKDSTKEEYQALLDAYRNRPFNVMVISGSFSPCIISRLKQDLTSTNVAVLNIIRNPTTCFVLSQQNEDYYKANPAANPVVERISLERSIINAALLAKDKTIQTFRYEDIIKNDGFNFNGKHISLLDSVDNHLPHNENITRLELGTLSQSVSQSDVDKWNSNMLNCEITMLFDSTHPSSIEEQQALVDSFNATYNSNITLESLKSVFSESNPFSTATLPQILPIFNIIEGTNVTVEQLNKVLPLNLFSELGYSPLTLSEVINP